MADETGPLAGILSTDPDMPPGTVELRSGDQRLRTLLTSAAAEALWQRFNGDPEFAEEIMSLCESKDYITYPGQMTGADKCEVCGTLVAFVPEVHSSVPLGSKPEPAPWEPGPWRKHTLRRCNAMRGTPDA